MVPVAALRPGGAAVIEVEIHGGAVRHGRRRSLLVTAGDGSGRIGLRFFHFSASQRAALREGATLRCFGEARAGAGGLEMVHPEYRILDPEATPPLEESLTPVYPTTGGLAQTSLRRLTRQVMAHLRRPGALTDLVPPEALARLGFPPLADALELVHHPPPGPAASALAPREHAPPPRLALEELLAHHLSLRAAREQRTAQTAPPLAGDGRLVGRFLAALPFALTAAQRRVFTEIREDLGRDRPMHRLLQGDVGSGKTVVAALAALAAIEAGHQVAIMAPTELLAEQHRRNLGAWFEPLAIEVAWLSGAVGGAKRRRTLDAIAAGRARLAVGTHALFQAAVEFAALGLVIVDEQHRFGVHQRFALWTKGTRTGARPHQLTLTATPIPRTLAMAAYADLDTSRIDELPPGRRPVETVAMGQERRAEVVRRVHAACRDGHQAYWVCPLIDESDTLRHRAAAETAEALSRALPDLRVGLLHGRLERAEKEGRMAAFAGGEVDLLVATTVVEVGVDVPNATLMIIENAERMGLAQLHQLRGRVGRGNRPSTCVLLYRGPLSPAARDRLAVLRECHDGFAIAERDLELRGPGELLGTRQAGALQFRIADLGRDAGLVPAVERIAREMLAASPDRVAPLVARWVRPAGSYGDV